MNVLLRKNCVGARARDGRAGQLEREKHSFLFPRPSSLMGSSLHRLSLHINVMRTKGPKQLVHDAL